MNKNVNKEPHIDIYANRSILHKHDSLEVFDEGPQSDEARLRYEKINRVLEDGYLDQLMDEVREQGFKVELPEDQRPIFNKLVEGISSNTGKALVGLSVVQLTIKAICPEQSIRLHKGSSSKRDFSWKEGVSMRSIDQAHVTPFLRNNDLLRMNAYGVMMTRTLAENYPYSDLYKAKLQGPREYWLMLVDGLETGTINAKAGLSYLLSLLLNKSEAFQKVCDEANDALRDAQNITRERMNRLIRRFLGETKHPARAFEIVMHSFMQAMFELNHSEEYRLEPLSQMRSANKKHKNIGDIEIKTDDYVAESWDAKYRKPYLEEELGELEDKLQDFGVKVEVAGFVTDGKPEIDDTIRSREDDLANQFDIEVKIMSFEDWISYEMGMYPSVDENQLMMHWLYALVGSFSLQRPDMAPIDEPCDVWVEDLTKEIRRTFK